MFGYSSEVFEGVKMLREKYDILRKGIEDICTDHENSTAGLDTDEWHERLIDLMKKDNELNLDKIQNDEAVN